MGIIPDSKFHGAILGPTWVLLAPDGPHVGPMNFAIWDILHKIYTEKPVFVFLEKYTG